MNGDRTPFVTRLDRWLAFLADPWGNLIELAQVLA
jgi:hypothetical protein